MPSDDAQAAEIKTWLRRRPEVEAILPGGRAEVQIGGCAGGDPRASPITPPTAIIGRCCNPPPTHGTAFATATPRFISEQLARRLKLGARRSDRRCRRRAETGRCEVVGIYADYGNPKGQIARQFRCAAPAFSGHSADAVGPARRPAAVPALIAALQNKFGLDGRNLADQATLKTESTRIFNRTFAVTSALNAFTLGVAGVALLTSLLTLSNSRLPQLAPLWAIGITRRRLAVIELLKTMSVALITALLALPLGLLVAWCLIAVVNVKAFGWRLPFHVFPLQLLELLAVAMLAALLAALLPVLKLARMQPASLVKIFADER